MAGEVDTSSTENLPVNGRLFKIGVVYFALFLAHSIWRITLHNNAANNFGLSESQIGYVLSATYIPGIFAFSIGLVARGLQLYKLIVFAALALAVGMFMVSSTVELTVLVFSALLIAFGFTFFYTVANSACLLGSEGDRASYDLGRLKSLGPLAGFFAAIIVQSDGAFVDDKTAQIEIIEIDRNSQLVFEHDAPRLTDREMDIVSGCEQYFKQAHGVHGAAGTCDR